MTVDFKCGSRGGGGGGGQGVRTPPGKSQVIWVSKAIGPPLKKVGPPPPLENVGPPLEESGSFRPWVVSAGSFRPGSFRPYLGVGRFGLFWWVVSAVSRFGRGSFRPV